MSELALDILKVASKAVKEAQRKSLENGQIYFQLPDGTITQEMLMASDNLETISLENVVL